MKKMFLVCAGALCLAMGAAIAGAPLISELASPELVFGLGVMVAAAVGFFASTPFLINNGHPRSIFETRRAGLA